MASPNRTAWLAMAGALLALVLLFYVRARLT
jgi:hypothetical protein